MATVHARGGVQLVSAEQWDPRVSTRRQHQLKPTVKETKNAEHEPHTSWFLTTLTNTETPCKNMMVSTIGSSSSLSSFSTVAISNGHQLRDPCFDRRSAGIRRELAKREELVHQHSPSPPASSPLDDHSHHELLDSVLGQSPEELDHEQQLQPELLNSVQGQSFDERHSQPMMALGTLLTKVRCTPPLALAIGSPLARVQDTPPKAHVLETQLVRVRWTPQLALATETLPTRVRCTPQLALATETLPARVRCTPQLALALALSNIVLGENLEDHLRHEDLARAARTGKSTTGSSSSRPNCGTTGSSTSSKPTPVCRRIPTCGLSSSRPLSSSTLSSSANSKYYVPGSWRGGSCGTWPCIPPRTFSPALALFWRCALWCCRAYRTLAAGAACAAACIAINVHHQPLKFHTKKATTRQLLGGNVLWWLWWFGWFGWLVGCVVGVCGVCGGGRGEEGEKREEGRGGKDGRVRVRVRCFLAN